MPKFSNGASILRSHPHRHLLAHAYFPKQASDLPIPHLRKPLKPLFLTPDSSFPTLPASPSFLPVLLVSASRYTPSRMAYSRQGGFTYIQGAGDDHEEWSQGLTPEIWWAHRERMLTLDRQALNEAILEAVGEAERQGTEGVPRFKSYDAQTQSLSEDVARIADTGIAIARRPTGHVFTQDELRQFTLIVHCSAPPSVGEVNDKKGSNSNASEDSTNTSDKTPNALVHSLGIPPGKRGVIDLYNALFRIVPLIGDVLNEQRSPSVSISISDSELEQDGKKRRKDVLICCRDGKDISVALAVAVLAVHFDDQKRLVLVHKLDSHRKCECPQPPSATCVQIICLLACMLIYTASFTSGFTSGLTRLVSSHQLSPKTRPAAAFNGSSLPTRAHLPKEPLSNESTSTSCLDNESTPPGATCVDCSV